MKSHHIPDQKSAEHADRGGTAGETVLITHRASAVVPLCVEESSTSALVKVCPSDPAILTWWGTEFEGVSALARRERDGTLSTARITQATERLRGLGSAWHEVQPATAVRATAAQREEFRLSPIAIPG